MFNVNYTIIESVNVVDSCAKSCKRMVINFIVLEDTETVSIRFGVEAAAMRLFN